MQPAPLRRLRRCFFGDFQHGGFWEAPLLSSRRALVRSSRCQNSERGARKPRSKRPPCGQGRVSARRCCRQERHPSSSPLRAAFLLRKTRRRHPHPPAQKAHPSWTRPKTPEFHRRSQRPFPRQQRRRTATAVRTSADVLFCCAAAARERPPAEEIARPPKLQARNAAPSKLQSPSD